LLIWQNTKASKVEPKKNRAENKNRRRQSLLSLATLRAFSGYSFLT